MPRTDPPHRPSLTALEAGRGTTSRPGRRSGPPPGPPIPAGGGLPALESLAVRRRSRRPLGALAVALVVLLGAGALAAEAFVHDPGTRDGAIVAGAREGTILAVPAAVPALTPPAAPVRHADTVPATWPFAPPPGLRRPRPGELSGTLYADGRLCSVGCRPIGAVDAWPLKPFHRQHPLRAGLNELRGSGFHVGIDIQARDGSEVYALQPGYVRILAATGPDARVQVGNYIYWHVHPALLPGSYVTPLNHPLGTVLHGFGHLHLSEVGPAGAYVNPLRPGGRVLTPYLDTTPPVLAHPRVDATGGVQVAAFDPQSVTALTTYLTPVLAPAGLAYRLYDSRGVAETPLEWGLRGTWHLPPTDVSQVYAADSGAPGYDCFAGREVCVPRWDYRLAGGLAPALPLDLAAGTYRLTAYAFDWAGNASAIDERVHLSAAGWEPVGRFQAPMSPILGSAGAGGEAAGYGYGYGYGSRLGNGGSGTYGRSGYRSASGPGVRGGSAGERSRAGGGRGDGTARRSGQLSAPTSTGSGRGRGTQPGQRGQTGASGGSPTASRG